MSTPVANPASPSLATIPLWINGRSVAPHGTRRGEVTNASTGEVVRSVPFADARDVDAAVAAATAAFPAWRAVPPLRRARIITRFRELMEHNQKALATVISEEHGKVFLDAMGEVQRGIEVVEFAAGAPHLLKGAHSESVGRGVDAYSRLRAGRRLRRHHAVQFPGDGADVDVPARARLREHLHPQAVGEGSVGRRHDGGTAQGGRAPRGRLQRRARRQGSRGRHPAPSGHSRGVVRRIHADRQVHLFDGGRGRKARAGARRRQEPRSGAAGRRPRASPPTRSSVPPTARPANAAWRSPRSWPSARLATGSSPSWRRKRRTLKIGPGTGENMDMGPLVTCAHRDKVQGYIDTGVEEGAQPDRGRTRVEGAGLRRRLLPRAHALRSRHARDDDLQGRDLRARAGRAAREYARRSHRPRQQRTRMETARPCSRTQAAPRAVSRNRSRSAWSASTCRSRCRWRSTRLAAGNSRCSATCTCTAWKASPSTRARRPSPALAEGRRRVIGIHHADARLSTGSGKPAAGRPSG